MKKILVSVHNYPERHGVDCYWGGERAGETSDPRCTQLEDEIIGFSEALAEQANWPEVFIMTSEQCENLEWFIRVRADRIFTDVDTDECLEINIHNQEP